MQNTITMKKLLFLLLPFLMISSNTVSALHVSAPISPTHFVFDEDRNCEESEMVNASNFEITDNDEESTQKPSFIKWIDFNVSKEILEQAFKANQKLKHEKYGTCELLAYIALKNGNSFNFKADIKALNKLVAELTNGNDSNIAKYAENKYYKYYVESYHAVLDGIINADKVIGFFPLAKDYWYRDYDDFGNSRGYGYKRRHLGHDMFGGTGTPIIAVEGGIITELGWNQYGGWRIGIRSNDTKRYYYYAHLRKNHPYPKHFKVGDNVEAGDVIGYLGVTGYSRKQNTNMTTTQPHLHFGMQIIFDPSQEDGNGEIWIDVFQITRFLSRNKMATLKNAESGEHEKKVIN